MTTATGRMPTADRRAQIRVAAARLFATSGFHGVTIEDIGAACGISGPAVYRHFPSKVALLGDLLIGISEYLLDGAQSAVASGQGISELVRFHVAFSLQYPDLIRVQDRDLDNLGPAARNVRRLQRRYVDLWVEALQQSVRGLHSTSAATRVHAAFGLLNSTPHSAVGLDPVEVRELLSTMALAALLC